VSASVFIAKTATTWDEIKRLLQLTDTAKSVLCYDRPILPSQAEIDQALDELAKVDGQLVRVVEMRYFAGLDNEEIAASLGVTDRTVRRHWEKARLMLSNYRLVRPIAAAELASLPLLARGSALRFLLTRLYDWLNHPAGAMVRPKDPLEYLQKLRFHRSVAGPGAYGLE